MFDSTDRACIRPAGRPGPGPARADATPVWLAVGMDYRPLGTTGLQVSQLCLGAMMFGAWGNPDHDDSVRIIRRAVDAGINFIDTADMYSFGESEVIVGKALQGLDREHLVLATKVHGPMSGDPNAQGNSRRWVIAECEHSLKRLGTDYLDLYQIHRPSPETDIDDTLGALSDLVHAGTIRYAGCSTFPAHQVVESHWVAERRGRERFRTEQPQYSMLARGIEADLLPVCRQYGMGVLSWSPLAGGWLSGAFGEGKKNTSRRSAMLPERYDLSLPDQPAEAGCRHRAPEGGRRGRPLAPRTGAGLRAGPPGGHLPDHRATHHGAARVPAGHRATSRSATTCSTGSTRSHLPGRTSAVPTPAGPRRR